MILEFHDKLKSPTQRRATRLVVYDNFGNAIATFLQVDEKNTDVRVRGQPGFEEALEFLGIAQTVVMTTTLVKDKTPLLLG